LLIHGGTISSGFFNTVSVVASYWMSCINGFSKITLPGVSARLRRPRTAWHRMADLEVAVPGLDVLGQHV
jgi:hypothetical protein